MRVVLMAVGSPRQPGLAAAIREYEERAARYFPLEVIETVPATRRSRDPVAAPGEEASEILRRLPPRLEAWALTREGVRLGSLGLAQRLGEMATYGHPGIVFLVGGAFGLADTVLDAAQRRVSLSDFTLPHELARLVLTEQIYRAGTILRGEPYHKGDR